MKKTSFHFLGLILATVALTAIPLSAQWFLDIETGGAFARSNDVRVPNETGTLFSLTDDLNSAPALAVPIPCSAILSVPLKMYCVKELSPRYLFHHN